jgi:hypothetical protein
MTLGPDDKALVRQLRQARHIGGCREVDLDRARSELVATRPRRAAFASQHAALLRRLSALEQPVAQGREHCHERGRAASGNRAAVTASR